MSLVRFRNKALFFTSPYGSPYGLFYDTRESMGWKWAQETLQGLLRTFSDYGEPTKIVCDWGRGPIEYTIFVGGIVG